MFQCKARCKNNPLKQCSFNHTSNSIFCSKHKNVIFNSKYNINNPFFSDTDIQNFIIDYQSKNFIINYKKHILIIKYILLQNKFIIPHKDIKSNILIYPLYNIHHIYTNSDYVDIFNTYLHFRKNLKHIIYTQSIFRKNLIYNFNKLKGPAFLNKSKSVNDTDFYTFQSLDNIHYNYFFSFEENSHIYSFDIRSFILLIHKFKSTNPYTRNIISQNIINNSNTIITYLKNNNLYYDFKEDILTVEQENTQFIIKIFQKIDSFGYNTDISWFSNLSISQLNKLWFYLEDIWNFRANLSIQQKNNIINLNQNNSNKPFLMYYKFKNKNIDKLILQKYILSDFDIFISSGITDEFSNVGCLYVLTALSMVSQNCLNSMPWLNQLFI